MPKTVKKKPSAVQVDDVMPPLILVVDENVNVKELNAAAREFLGPGHRGALNKRNGEAFDCAHRDEATNGCGHGKFCQLCPIREAVALACKQQRVVRRRTKAETGGKGKAHEVHLLVTAMPIPSRRTGQVLLILEDISALLDVLDPVALCASCKRVRTDDRFWQQMDAHFRQHLDVDLSHGVCPECKERIFGKLLGGKGLTLSAT